MLISSSLFAVFFSLQGTRVTLIASIDEGGYTISLPSAGRYTIRAGDSPVELHNNDGGFVCPPRGDTEIEWRRSPSIGHVGHTFRLASPSAA